ncbi:MAG: hypothetical protein KDA85_07845, partial [Planctomycetaceae bacterium]|nr:hypothetical protein [Planctomycetaceae bacterium]
VLSSEKMEPITGRLKSSYQEIPLALGELPTRTQVETDTQSDNKYIVGRAKLLLKQLDEQGHLDQTYPYPVQVWRIGNQATTVVLGGEVVEDYSLRIKQEFPDHNIFVSGYSNDVMAYIPSLRVLNEGGYEGASSMIYYGLPTVWSQQLEEQIIGEVHRQIDP